MYNFLYPLISLEPMDGISPNLHGYIIGTSLIELIRFWWPWPHFQGHWRTYMTISCTHYISWTNEWNFTKLAWIHHWDKFKSWLDFGDLDLIFKVTGGLRWKFLVPVISPEPMDGISPNLHGLHHWDKFKRLIRFWWPWPHFQGHWRTYMTFSCTHWYLLNQWMEFHQTCMDTSFGQV